MAQRITSLGSTVPTRVTACAAAASRVVGVMAVMTFARITTGCVPPSVEVTGALQGSSTVSASWAGSSQALGVGFRHWTTAEGTATV